MSIKISIRHGERRTARAVRITDPHGFDQIILPAEQLELELEEGDEFLVSEFAPSMDEVKGELDRRIEKNAEIEEIDREIEDLQRAESAENPDPDAPLVVPPIGIMFDPVAPVQVRAFDSEASLQDHLTPPETFPIDPDAPA